MPTKKRKVSSEPPVSTSEKVDIIKVILDGDSEVVLQEQQSKKVKATFVDTASASTSSQSTAVSATVLTGAIKKKKAPPQLVSRKNQEARGPHPTIGRDPKRFYCEQCSRHFTYEKGLKEHMAKRCGQMKKQFKCGYCYRNSSQVKSARTMLQKNIWIWDAISVVSVVKVFLIIHHCCNTLECTRVLCNVYIFVNFCMCISLLYPCVFVFSIVLNHDPVSCSSFISFIIWLFW